MQRRDLWQDGLVIALLVALGVAGRWGELQWSFTPIGATALFAGYYFQRRWVALSVPLLAMGLSDLLLPSYDNAMVVISVYGAMALPVLLGGWLKGATGPRSLLARSLGAAWIPSTLFFLVTNFSVWKFQSHYPETLEGLVQCYLVALPFYRWMLAGDFLFTLIIFGCYAADMAVARRAVRA